MNAEWMANLSSAEKLQRIEELCDDLTATPSDVPMHAWQREELTRRRANLKRHPDAGLAWGEVKARVRSRFGT